MSAMFHKIRSFLKAREGVAVVEFALLVPVMLVLYLGSIETVNLMSANRKMTVTATTVTDLVARINDVSDAEINSIFAAVNITMQPYDTSDMEMVVSSVVACKIGEDVRYFVDWSDSANNNRLPYSQGDEVVLPESENGQELAGINETVIFSEVLLPYAPIFTSTSLTDYTSLEMNDAFYMKPRRTIRVNRCDDYDSEGKCDNDSDRYQCPVN